MKSFAKFLLLVVILNDSQRLGWRNRLAGGNFLSEPAKVYELTELTELVKLAELTELA